MNRSITSRNFAGGFLGGVLGILFAWYIAPIILPLGVFVGVVIGWWAEDIVQMFVRSAYVAIGIMKYRKQVATLLHSRFNRTVAVIGTAVRGVPKAIQHIVVLPSLMFVLPLLLLRRFRRWIIHPTGAATMITLSAIVVGAVINALAFGLFYPWPETTTVGGVMNGTPVEVVPFPFLDLVVLTGLAALFLTMFGMIGIMAEDDESNSMSSFYARWERYSRYSPITYFVRELFRFFKSEVVVAIFFALTIVYWATLGGALITLVVVPVAVFVTFMIGLYKIVQRSAHWWCFGITLVTTGISALVFYNSFDNEAILWTVALCTGITSGVATEGLRHLGMWWSNTAMGRYYLDVWYDEDKAILSSIAIPAWRMLLRVFKNASKRFALY